MLLLGPSEVEHVAWRIKAKEKTALLCTFTGP